MRKIKSSPNPVIKKYQKIFAKQQAQNNSDKSENIKQPDYDAIIHLYFRTDGTAHYVAGISNGDGTFCFYNSDSKRTLPMTWEEYLQETHTESDILYECTFDIQRKK